MLSIRVRLATMDRRPCEPADLESEHRDDAKEIAIAVGDFMADTLLGT